MSKIGLFSVMMKKLILSLLAFVAISSPALADYPHSWGLGLQEPAGVLMQQMSDFHHMLVYIIVAIAAFVLALLIWVVVRYNAKANPVPSKTTHNTLLEVVWTVIPVVILIVIAVPSFKVLFSQGRIPQAEMTLKVTGYQWYWGYEYPDQGGIAFNANMIPEKEIDPSKGQKRLLETDNELVLPVDTVIRVQITASDVIHAWTVPAFGVKKDAMPGRLNEAWFKITKPGIYYGQCSEICGNGHAYMPIKVRAVSKEEFATWAAEAKTKFGSNVNSNITIAQTEVQ
ncbi:MAG: cytochrome c oxidase subunit II [Alphaproteobacteria bacterium]|nr:cytochrome c oxidase subunit II [Alphaproteobacteria bacterium]